ncbi:response regulator [Ramlibacter sp. PS3R-8]|uniref:response regulator n=1 Tax=Ramlibacter sp. PS3R-8 TaxID=3133437 RepID=UPI0030A26ED7
MKRKKVFLVDDSEAITRSLTILLEDTGRFEVVGVAQSQKAALAWLFDDANHWDVAVVDLMLKPGSGIEVLVHCQKYHAGKVVVLSDFVSQSVAERCMKFGALGAFQKSQLPEFIEFMKALASKP